VFYVCCINLHIVIILWWLWFFSDFGVSTLYSCISYFLSYFYVNRVILEDKDSNVLN